MIIMIPKVIVVAVFASFIAVSCGEVSVSEEPQPEPHTTVPTTSSTTTTSTTTTTATTTSKATTPASTTTTPNPEPLPTTITTPKTTTPPTTTSPTTTSPSTTSSAPITTPTPKPSPKPPQKPDVGNWNVTSGNITCILVDMAVQLNVSYTAKDNTTNYAIIDVPKNTTANGTCVGKTQLFNLTWFQNATKSELYLTFTRNEKEDRFMIGMINLTVIPDDVVFPNIKSNDSIILFSNKTEFTTPVSKSYRCEKEQVFELEKVGTNITGAKMTVSHVHLEAFHTKKNAEFGAVEDCEPSSSPDIVPIAVGCALVGLVAIVLIAYLVGRRRSQARGYLSIVRSDSENDIPLQHVSQWKKCWK